MGGKSSKTDKHSDKRNLGKADSSSDHVTECGELSAVEDDDASRLADQEKDSRLEQEDVPEDGREASESDSRVTTGSEPHQEAEAESVTETDSDGVDSSEAQDEDEDETPEEYDTDSVPEDHVENHEELMSALEEAMESSKGEEVKLATSGEDNRRIASGADVAGYQYQEELEIEDTSEIDLNSAFSALYPILSEHRENGMILISVHGPRADETEQFWQMIVEKRIPTIHMECDYVEQGFLKCAPYIPIHGETEISCGVYTIKRLGPESQLSMNLKRQQLLIYEKVEGSGLEYKHSVTHFQETTSENLDESQHVRNTNVIYKHVSHQPNPQLLVHGSW